MSQFSPSSQMAEDRGRTFERHALEKESSDLQRKMESLAWRRERAELSKRVAELKTKVVALQDKVTSKAADEQVSEHVSTVCFVSVVPIISSSKH